MKTSNDTQPAKGRISSLRYLFAYILPYRRQALGATVALVVTSTVVLGMGSALSHLIDKGIAKGNQQLLGQGYLILLAVVVELDLPMACTWDSFAQSDVKWFSCKAKSKIQVGTCIEADLPPKEVACPMNLCADLSLYPCLKLCQSDDECPLFVSCKAYDLGNGYNAKMCGDETP